MATHSRILAWRIPGTGECAGKARNPFQTTQGNRLSCRDQEGRRGSEEAVPGPSVFPSGETGVSGDFWGSQEGCQGPFRPSGADIQALHTGPAVPQHRRERGQPSSAHCPLPSLLRHVICVNHTLHILAYFGCKSISASGITFYGHALRESTTPPLLQTISFLLSVVGLGMGI